MANILKMEARKIPETFSKWNTIYWKYNQNEEPDKTTA